MASPKKRTYWKKVLADVSGAGLTDPGDGILIRTPASGYKVIVTKAVFALATTQQIKWYYGTDDPDAAGNSTIFHHPSMSHLSMYQVEPGSDHFRESGSGDESSYIAIQAGTNHNIVIWGYDEEV